MAIGIKFWITLLWLLVGAVWLVTAVRLKPVETMQAPGSRIAQTLLLIWGAILMFYQWPANDFLVLQIIPATPAIRFVGIALTLVGTVITIIARIYLGSNWSGSATIKLGHELIRSGPYSVVRHPI